MTARPRTGEACTDFTDFGTDILTIYFHPYLNSHNVPPFPRHFFGLPTQHTARRTISRAALSICPPSPTPQLSLKPLDRCECHTYHLSSFCSTKYSAINQHLPQGEHTLQPPYLARSLIFQTPALCRQRDCTLGLRLPFDIRR